MPYIYQNDETTDNRLKRIIIEYGAFNASYY